MKYKVQVCMTYVQFIDVDAPDLETAEQTAFDSFDLSKAHRGEGECWTVETEGETV
jgi:hypothetical protein